ncbi:COG3650 family protein [Saccharospirillum mangrovi]|uniref:COG3650 family protein n=1 Tax=Saccharospirillum mangrovi TaxID=2161747 RepID=UPI000D3683EA|nr:MliC family protein [Saccharospirillum mangrovi]
MNARQRLFSLLLAIVTLAGCASKHPAVEPADLSQLVVFDCQSLALSLVPTRDDEALLYLPDRLVTVRHQPAASGVLYLGDGLMFWSKGDSAQLRIDDQPQRACELSTLRQPRDRQGRYPIDFRATGNEPGWLLELSHAEIRLLTDYGQSRTVMPLPTPEVDGQTLIYRANRRSTNLVLHLEPMACQDTMSDETFEWTVEVTLNGQSLQGCGRPLTDHWH